MRRYRIWFQFDGVLELGVRYEKAREHFNRALQLDPEYGDAIVELAEIYIPQDPAAARALCLRAVELNTNLGAAHTILGLVTDSLITDLAGLKSVRVISRTSAMHYKGSRKTLPEIARELNVDAVVEGTVMRLG